MLIVWYLSSLAKVEIQLETLRTVNKNDRNSVVHGRESVELGIEIVHGIKGLQEMSQR